MGDYTSHLSSASTGVTSNSTKASEYMSSGWYMFVLIEKGPWMPEQPYSHFFTEGAERGRRPHGKQGTNNNQSIIITFPKFGGYSSDCSTLSMFSRSGASCKNPATNHVVGNASTIHARPS